MVGRIERIRHSPLHVSISEGVDQWQNGIRDLQNRRKEELSSNNCSRSRLNSSLRNQDSTGIKLMLFNLVCLNVLFFFPVLNNIGKCPKNYG